MKFINLIFRTLIAFIFYISDSFVILSIPLVPRKNNLILLSRLDHIGDYLLWASQLKLIREVYPAPQYSITLIANATWASMILDDYKIDRIFPINPGRLTRSLKYRFIMFRSIRKMGANVFINPVFSREPYRADSLARISGSKIKIGFRGDESNTFPWLKRITNRWYTKLIEGNFSQLSELEKNAEFVSSLGGPYAPGLIGLNSSPHSIAHNFVGENYFIFVPGGSWLGRCWPIDKFIELAKRLQDKFELPGVICGTLEERELGNKINAGLRVPLINLCGKTTLTELIDVVSNANILITNETGTAHLGAAANVPTICILGGGHFGRFFPYPSQYMPWKSKVIFSKMECYGCNWNCIYDVKKNQAVPCIEKITVDAVWHEILNNFSFKN